MSNKNSPCLGCNKRVVGCHGYCEDYAAAKAELDRKRCAYKQAKKKESDVADFIIRSMNKTMRRPKAEH